MEIQKQKQGKNLVGLSIAHKITQESWADKSIYNSDVDTGGGCVQINKEFKDARKKKDVFFSSNMFHGGTLVSINAETEGGVNQQIGGGIRGVISGFSRASRRNLLSYLYKLDRSTLSEDEVLFLTLTYDGNTEKNKWLSRVEYKRHLKNILTAIERKYGGFGIWRFELQKRLVGHFHVIWYKSRFISHHWLSRRWNEITEGSIEHLAAGVQVERARSWKGVSLYGSKTMGYVAKDESTHAQREHLKKINVGRFWGIWNKKEFDTHINEVHMDLSHRQYSILMRNYKNLQKSWKRKKEDKKGWNSFKKFWMHWKRLRNTSIDFYIENGEFLKLMAWINSKLTISTRENIDEKYKKLHRFRWLNGYGSYGQELTPGQSRH